MIKLSIVVVAFKNMDCLATCLESIPALPWIEVIVVNNSHQNRGFSAGCNLGARLAKGEFLLFLNPDCIVSESALTRLISVLEADKTIGIVGPKLTDIKGKAYLSCNGQLSRLASPFVYSFLNKLLRPWKLVRDYWFGNVPPSTSVEVGSVCGAAMGMRKKVFDSVHGFDERFFLYWEEFDLAIRVAKKRLRVVFDPSVTIVHEGELSTTQPKLQVMLWFRESRYYFFKKHFGRLYAVLLEGWLTFSEEWRYLMGIALMLGLGLWFYSYGWWLSPGYLPFWERWLDAGLQSVSVGYWIGVGGALFVMTMVYNEFKSVSRWTISLISVLFGLLAMVISVIGPVLAAIGGVWMMADLRKGSLSLRKKLVMLAVVTVLVSAGLLVQQIIQRRGFYTNLSEWSQVSKLMNTSKEPISIRCVGCVTGKELIPLRWILLERGMQVVPSSSNTVYLFLPPYSLSRNLLPDAITVRTETMVIAWPLSSL